jgi:hypothetical protein
MSKALEKALYKAAVLTFEELGFMLPSPELDNSQLAAQPAIAVSVRFHGPFAGELLIVLCGELLPVIAANMLGEDSVPALEQQYDALRETGNVICGNMLPLIAGTKPVFNVELPVVIKDLQQRGQSTPAAFSQVGIEDGRADLKLFLDDPSALEALTS